jgi:nucleotide-binding universal stress UspA family protein
MAGFRKILVPVDFSAHSSKALELAIELAKISAGKIHLLHCYQINFATISPYGIVIPESFERELRDAATKQIAIWRDRVKAKDIEADTEVSPVFPSEAIAITAERIGADLIVMGTRGLSGLKHVMLGSVAERTVRTASCPVLTVKAAREA